MPTSLMSNFLESDTLSDISPLAPIEIGNLYVGSEVLDFAVCTPPNCHLLCLIYKIDFAMERCLSSRWKIDDLTDKRDVFRFQGDTDQHQTSPVPDRP